ncbi:hypothetical protein Cflav_PD1480 [Pedosphaera parvula Ellin514]|uniref:Uncharacterized protein n=1 Tax=Pedosphaera parvula (strain Ellin514) TaxID=320771 RepID=B9XPV5_PEDPL|nr:hypothetical protein Cflav_PD1480 [Pedosphaera parvula Ellin514]
MNEIADRTIFRIYGSHGVPAIYVLVKSIFLHGLSGTWFRFFLGKPATFRV